MYVCVCEHAYGRIFQLHQIFQDTLWSEEEELISLGSKSETTFPYFNPKYQKFTT